MKLCFLVEELYRHDGMPLDVVRQLKAWGHQVDVVRPGGSLLRISEEVRAGTHDAWVLKTVSGGPGLTLLEAAAAVGLTTVNDARSIRAVRDKVLTSVIARQHGLPVPVTYSAPRAELFADVPAELFPLVVKPADGSSGRGVRIVSDPEGLAEAEQADEGQLIAQPYVANAGSDLKVYCLAGEFHATVRRSPLHPDAPVDERAVPLPAEVAAAAAKVGAVFGLDLYGIDVVLGPDGPVVVDINDFPSFRQVPDAVSRLAGAVLELARTGGADRAGVPAATPRVPVPAQGPHVRSHPHPVAGLGPGTEADMAAAVPEGARI
ncbi:RimK family alpha-L-glutamate ligase [Streptomyces sp. NPDC059278]|uniref:ATP-grasp domain-containing protein n=1 Tax=Streptomyces sp. NPDC059278 TaxID=3346801 RepID=UPI0036A2A7F0